MARFQFRLFIAGNTPRSHQAAANLRRLAEERLDGDYELTIIDVVEDPELAESERILTTPTLVKVRPGPARRVTGDLSDANLVMLALALAPQAGVGRREDTTS